MLLDQFVQQRVASRIWQKDTTVFAPAGRPRELHQAIAERLGWLDIVAREIPAVRWRGSTGPTPEEFARGISADGLTDVYLLGTGGSSLCAEVLRDVAAEADRRAAFTVLDTVDERAVRRATASLEPNQSLFLVASKSGSTIEVRSLERHFWEVMSDALGPGAGRHFAAITDPGTLLAQRAGGCDYRHVFINPPDVGGRYSALSLFGRVPAVVLGIDLAALIESARTVADACRDDNPSNPGLQLGAFLAESATAGRHKLTVLLSPPLATLGAWIEQLVAESTGKQGRGILPIVDEPLDRPEIDAADRAFVAVLTADDRETSRAVDALEHAGHSVFRIAMAARDLGGEFFRWEFATAVAGAVLGVNPFDEPNVRDAKVRTEAQLDVYCRAGSFTFDPPFDDGGPFSVRAHEPRRNLSTGYMAILDYLPAGTLDRETIAGLRARLRSRTRLATTYGIGPRYLHSTGQYHKGGPNTGVFLLLTADADTSTPIPGQEYSFATLKQAQALGDFEALADAGRRVLHVHYKDVSSGVSDLEPVIDAAFRTFRIGGRPPG